MKALLQRVSRASLSVEGRKVGSIGQGMVVLVAIMSGDREEDARYLVEKLLHLRLFGDDDDRFNLSLEDIKGELMLVSEFTLAADTRKGRRPNFIRAAPPQEAEPLFDYVVDLATASGRPVVRGCFGKHMLLSLDNDGPVTIALDSSERLTPRRQHREALPG